MATSASAEQHTRPPEPTLENLTRLPHHARRRAPPVGLSMSKPNSTPFHGPYENGLRAAKRAMAGLAYHVSGLPSGRAGGPVLVASVVLKCEIHQHQESESDLILFPSCDPAVQSPPLTRLVYFFIFIFFYFFRLAGSGSQ